jgi:hypothetical protein
MKFSSVSSAQRLASSVLVPKSKGVVVPRAATLAKLGQHAAMRTMDFNQKRLSSSSGGATTVS